MKNTIAFLLMIAFSCALSAVTTHEVILAKENERTIFWGDSHRLNVPLSKKQTGLIGNAFNKMIEDDPQSLMYLEQVKPKNRELQKKLEDIMQRYAQAILAQHRQFESEIETADESTSQNLYAILQSAELTAKIIPREKQLLGML